MNNMTNTVTLYTQNNTIKKLKKEYNRQTDIHLITQYTHPSQLRWQEKKNTFEETKYGCNPMIIL